jgi:signal transduction histidine kinase
MKRIRSIFLVVAVAVIIPVAWLVYRALTGLEHEVTREHETIAKRTFDEMERELSNVVNREEARPFEEYRYVYAASPEKLVKGDALEKSPLTPLPTDPRLLGYFQLQPDGQFRTPHQPTREEALELDRAWTPPDNTVSTVSRLSELTAKLWPRSAKEGDLGGVLSSTTQAPGTTQTMARLSTATSPTARLPALSTRAYGSLNRGTQSRRSRSGRISKVSSYNVEQFQQKLGSANAPLLQTETDKEPVTLSLEPVVGRVIDGDYFALYRTVWSGEQAYRQGLIFRLQALATFFLQTLLSSEEFAQAKLIIEPITQSSDLEAPYVFRHRFAEPFGDLHATLALPELPTESDAGAVWALALVVILASTVGLFALYRAAAVVVRFAQRRSDFVSAVTHELKTPLTVIRMNAEMLQENMVSGEEKRHEYYGNIARESDRLGRLINNVLELSKIERGDQTVNLVKGSIIPVLNEVVDTLRPHARERGFDLKLSCPETLPGVFFDRDALAQVVFNLVDNALKYAKAADNKTVTLTCEAQQRGVTLRIRDYGPGVSAQHLKHVFKPFYRGTDELTRTSKGTGIGLALVSGLVERMQGTVRGLNASDGGFEVQVSLPFSVNAR